MAFCVYTYLPAIVTAYKAAELVYHTTTFAYNTTSAVISGTNKAINYFRKTEEKTVKEVIEDNWHIVDLV